MDNLLPGLSHAANLHPMVVHFPIAFWVAAAGFWTFGLVRNSDAAWRFGLWCQTLGAAAAIVAVAFGFWATDKLGHEGAGHDLVHAHRDLMVVATGVALLIAGIAWWRRSPTRTWRILLAAASIGLMGLMTFGADRGAELVFRYGVGVAHQEPPQLEQSHHHDGPSHADGITPHEGATPSPAAEPEDGDEAHDHADHPH